MDTEESSGNRNMKKTQEQTINREESPRTGQEQMKASGNTELNEQVTRNRDTKFMLEAKPVVLVTYVWEATLPH